MEPLHKIIFSKAFFRLAYSTYYVFEKKIRFDLFMMLLIFFFLVIVRNFRHLEYEFKISFELESNSGIENINESLGGLYFHLLLNTQNVFCKNKLLDELLNFT